jgi:hypothetical protein
LSESKRTLVAPSLDARIAPIDRRRATLVFSGQAKGSRTARPWADAIPRLFDRRRVSFRWRLLQRGWPPMDLPPLHAGRPIAYNALAAKHSRPVGVSN